MTDTIFSRIPAILSDVKIVHLSYPFIKEFTNPVEWLERIGFFTGVVEAMSHENEVVSIHCINYSGILIRKDAQFHFINPTWWQRMIPFLIHKYLKKLQPDVVIVHGLQSPGNVLLLKFALRTKAKIYVQHHGEFPGRFYKRLFQTLVDPFVVGYFFTSLELAKPWVDAKLIRNFDKVFEVMEASSSFSPIIASERAVAKASLAPNDQYVYLWVGRLDENKDPETLLNAFLLFASKNTNIILYVIFQENKLIETVRRLASLNTNQIVLVGKVAHDELVSWYNAADFIISTSHREGSGIAVCEAMSCGCIPILSDIPSFKVMTGPDKCGLIYQRGNVNALFETLQKSLSIDLVAERKKVFLQFERELSFKAIATRIHQAICHDHKRDQ